jgi:hypothetical protein
MVLKREFEQLPFPPKLKGIIINMAELEIRKSVLFYGLSKPSAAKPMLGAICSD